MSSLKYKVYPIAFSGLVILGTSALILNTERNKRIENTDSVKNYYSLLYSDWETYKGTYLLKVSELKTANRIEMEITKNNYERLLTEQPALIAEHTRSVEQTSYVPQKNTAQNNTQNSKNTSQVIVVKKPKSAPSTGAS